MELEVEVELEKVNKQPGRQTPLTQPPIRMRAALSRAMSRACESAKNINVTCSARRSF